MPKTSVKLIDFEYGPLRTAIATAPTYTKCQGILKGFTLSEADPDANTIDSELFSAPFDTIYQGKPVVFKFDLVNFELSDLTPLFGGTYSAGTPGTVAATYDAPADITTTEHEWRVSFQRGFDNFILFDGLTIGTVKKDANGALGYSVTATAKILKLGDINYIYRITDKIITP